MWNRQKPHTSEHPKDAAKPPPAAPIGSVTPSKARAMMPESAPAQPVAALGSSLVINGELSSSEDLFIDGQIEGTISLPGHTLTIGPQATISAAIVAKELIIEGSVTGNVTANERFEIRSGGRMHGDLLSPKIVMADDSEFRGRVDLLSPRGKDST
jgi:cytoskeletal protein CcmA (bactofilin family)